MSNSLAEQEEAEAEDAAVDHAAMLSRMDFESPSAQAAYASLPEFMKVKKIPPEGWCFYDAVVAAVRPSGDSHVSRFSLAGLARVVGLVVVGTQEDLWRGAVWSF